MSWIDVIASYLFVLKYLVYGLAIILVISGLDDLFIDLAYWFRRLYRTLFVYSKHPRHEYLDLHLADEKPFAIMVPAWQEHGVVGPMAELAANTLDYENYHIFVGTYPNDEKTQADVDAVCARFPNVHKVVCAKPGPTSKADCLNNIIGAITLFEQQAKFEFSGFILHDAEDVISAMELRLFNHLVDRKDLIQLPVYPFARKLTDFTSGHYLDEFAELHGKDVPVREALVGQVPSAGVGTCFSRRAINILLTEGQGVAFDVQSLTEDYDIGIRLRQHGLEEIFVRYPVVTSEQQSKHKLWTGKSLTQSSVVCIREYFPDTFHTAVRQKSRWIIGIVFQGFKNHAWSSDWRLNYFLWRDRKGGITNLVGFLAVLIFSQLGLLWLVQHLVADSYNFLSIYGDEKWLAVLLTINAGLLINRMLQRFIFVTSYYGWVQGLVSLPRMVWGNIINFFANVRALRQVLAMGDARRVAWDKTSHDFPHIGEQTSRQRLGEILVQQQVLAATEIESALQNKPVSQKLGRYLLNQAQITPMQLASALAAQAHVPVKRFDLFAIAPSCWQILNKQLAYRYQVIVIENEKDQLLLASENYLSPVTLAAITRKLGKKANYVIALPGTVTQALEYGYHMNATEQEQLKQQYALRSRDSLDKEIAQQYSVIEIVAQQQHLSNSIVNQLLIGFEKTDISLAQYFVDKEVIDWTTLGQLNMAFSETNALSFNHLTLEATPYAHS